MGNVVSKKKSTKEIIKNIDKKIIQIENKKKNVVKSQSSINMRIIYLLCIMIVVSLIYGFLYDHSCILLIFFSFLVCGILRFLFSLVYNWHLENILFTLEDLREQQKEYIKLLKSEEEYKDTIELVNKYEDSTLRNTSFSRITQKKPNVLDKMTDIILGDDPTKMYALICSHCHYHNGMIHPDDNLSEYNCYNCGTKNTRKVKS